MKEVFVDVRPWNKDIVISALESGADGVIVEDKDIEKVRELGRIKVIAKNGDITLDKDIVEVTLATKEDERKIAKLQGQKVIVYTKVWTIIPLENLIAETDGLYSVVSNVDEAKTAIGILEKGVDGIVIRNTNPVDVRNIVSSVKSSSNTITLQELVIKKITILGLGDRVCVDTCTNMKIGQGMLVGNTSDGFLLVHSETLENPYVEPRPFRVNAGGVHAYILTLNQKTRYLSELKSGDSVLIVDANGNSQPAIVGRVKIEKRPLLLVECEYNKKPVSLILQNAETINLTQVDGKPISVVKIKPGDKVLGYVEEKGGRHFGTKIEESISER